MRCEASAEEEAAVLAWLAADPANRQEMNRLDAAFNAMVLHAPEAAQKRKRFTLRRIVRFAAAAAAAVLLMASSGWYFSVRQLDRLSGQMTAVIVPDGQRISMKLQDGSTVWLNAGTTMEYPTAFAASSRRVRVTGEALFDVAPDAKRPFVVETFACDVEVLGTRFNVEADEQAGRFSTALMRGRVRVVNRLSAGEQVVLQPDECVTLVGGHLNLDRIDNPDDFLWTEGIISLKDASFAELIGKIERSYGIRIKVLRSDLPRLSCRGKLRISDGIEHAMRILQTGADFSYEIDRETNQIYIR